MLGVLWLTVALPLAGFVLLALVGGRFSRAAISLVGVGSVGLAFLAALAVFASFSFGTTFGLLDAAFSQPLWTWLDVGPLRVDIALHLDGLSLIFLLVVTGVGFLIHLYSTEYMAGDEGYSRFFAYMNLFVAAMLVL
ncbi:MAG: NADH-quinone oxidoreductase subunit L, partial [Chloroflexota bacterium]